MNRKQYIFVLGGLLAAAAAQLSAQQAPPQQQREILVGPLGVSSAASGEGPTLNSGRNVPAQDLLNMKGGDRPLPLKDVGIDQRLGTQLPMDAKFRDENG